MLNKKFKYRHTMVLYLISEGYKEKMSNDEERERMKHFVIENKHQELVGKLLGEYEKNGSLERFIGDFKEIVYKGREDNESSGNYYSSTSDSDDNISSPQDTLLKRIKRGNMMKYEEGLKESSEKECNSQLEGNEEDGDLTVIHMRNVENSP